MDHSSAASSSLPRPSGLPRPAAASSRLPVLRPAASHSQLRAPASTTQLRSKPSLSSLAPTKTAAPTPTPAPAPAPTPSLSRRTSRIALVPSSTNAAAPSTLTRKSSRSSLLPAPAARRPSGTASQDPPAFKRPFARRPSHQAIVPPAPVTAAATARTRTRTPSASTSTPDDVLGSLNAFNPVSQASSRAGSRTNSRLGFRESSPSPDVHHPDAEPSSPSSRTPRSSLSDRTIESLSNLPSSPSNGTKGRRRSSFFNADKVLPPLRTTSSRSSSTSRPTTSDGPPRPLPVTPSKLAAPLNRLSMTAPGKRSVSAVAAPPVSTPTRRIASAPRPMSTIKKPTLAPAHNIQATPKLRPLNTKTASARTPKPEPSPTGSFGQALSPPGTTAAPAPFRQIPTKKTADAVRKISTPTTAVRNPPAKTRPAPKPEATASAATTPSKPSSSNALREQIAKAREAAKRNKAAPVRVTTPPRDVIIPDPAELAEFDFGLDDPFNQASKGGKSLLRKRVDGARADGRLNIAGMDLAEIPDDVLNMYQYDPSDASVAWGEVVDLTVIVAADNALDHLPEAMFPDVDIEDYVDSDEPGPQFGAVQSLDFHGNVLRELPIGLRRLTQLSKLNLSRNKLSMDVFGILAQIPGLRELKLAENDLQGELVADLQGLSQLEVLDLSNNKLTSLPAEIRELAHLRSLNVAENQLRSVPMELFTCTSLIQLTATKNRLEGSFFTVDVIPNLQELRLSNNALTSLSDSATLELPALTCLDLSTNRLSSLPDMTSWTNLATLVIGENKLAALPDGFLSLQKLRIADFTANGLTRLDERIALMEALENLSLAANPLRERKFLTMSTDDIRRDLASRLPSEVVDDDVDGEVLDDQVSGPFGGWMVTPAGTLDLSNNNLAEVDEEALLALAETKDIRQLNLQQNQLFAIPPALAQLSHLTTLDLSKNNITTLSQPIELPRLRDLRLAGNKLTSLAPLIENLTAPTLQSLDISQNRLTGALPALTSTFPALILLLASDNNLSSVPAPSLAGLRTVNIANNSIARLDPRIGLLAGSLASLVADGNTFRVPNYQTLQKGTEAVLAWLRERVPAAAVATAATEDDDDYEDENEQMGTRGQQAGWASARSSSGTAGEFFDADEGGF